MKNLSLTTADIIVFFSMVGLTLAAIVYSNRRRNTAGPADEKDDFIDFLLMGRQLTLPLFVMTLVATWYGGIFGVTRIAFESGIYNFITQGFFWYVTYVIFALFLVKKVRSFQAVTLPELVGKMYGPRSGNLAAIFNLFNVIPVAYTISLGLLLQLVFGLEPMAALLTGVGFVVFYTIFGGFRGDVFSDVVQFFFMCSGVLAVAVLAVFTYGGYDFLRAELPARHFSPTGGHSWATTLVWGLIAISTLIDPNFYQRCFAAKSEAVARRGILVSTAIWFVFDICTTLGGMYARAVMPSADPEKAYFYFSFELLPPGLRGLFLASLVATILSTINSYLFVAATTMTYDIFKVKKMAVKRTRWGIAAVGLFSVGMAAVFEGNIKDVWKTFGTYSTACLLFPVLCGYLSKTRISDTQFLTTSVAAVLTTSYWRNTERSGFWVDVDEMYIGLATSAALMGIFLLIRSYHQMPRFLLKKK